MKMHLKKYKTVYKKRRKRLKKILLVIFSCVITSFFLIYYINKAITPNIVKYAERQTKKISTIIINRAVTKQAAEKLDINDLVITNKDSNGKITGVDFNPYVVNKTLSSLTSTIQINLKRLEQGKIDLIELPDDVTVEDDKDKLKKGIIYEVPLSVAFNNSLLANIGPKIPIKLSLVEIVINVNITEQVLLPITSREINIETEIPVAIKLIEGTVPNYYSGNNSSSQFSIPIDE